MMRTFDSTVHDAIVHHPEIASAFGCEVGEMQISFAEMAKYPDDFALLHNEECDMAMAFEWSAPFTWQMHTLALPSCRGKRALKDGKAMIREMFVEHGACLIWGQTPVNLRAARIFNRWCGAKSVGFREQPLFGLSEVFMGLKDEWLERHP
ncbi:hypothetical protein OKW76_00480 [Sphingomonas sp. S1-29]|uniref:hypothetical protein n=1 Tax=Sphingomonas sp. S1-29 TaxID=2991074 RepID=UPI00223FD2F6|nr:hypothetical protein [Sphingomonas sp. S1-29]UZK69601.1 hypothetical protein OKW76_00480 [Sphingomonas sp. S1-29]